jgi:dipeptidyl aminopeptidase/acylaminoacyl peptidase
MRRWIICVAMLLATLTATSTLAAQEQQIPPLLDRELFFGDPEYAGAQVSPDGRHISFLKTNRGQLNVWVTRLGDPLTAARAITADSTRPVPGYFWSQDGRWVLFVQDQGGNENFHVYAVDPTAAAEPATGVPPARDLTPYGAVQAQIVAVPEATPAHILVALNDRDASKHDVYRVDIATGERKLVYRNDAGIIGFTADLAGDLRLGTRVSDTGESELLRIVSETDATPIARLPCDIFRSCAPVRFHKDNRRVYLITAAPGSDLTRLVLHDVETGRQEDVESDPEKQVDVGGVEFSDATDELVATYYVGDRLRIYPKDERFARDFAAVKTAVGDGDIYFTSSTNDDRLRVVTVTSDVDPGATYLYDRGTGQVKLLYRPYPKLPSEHLAAMRPVRYKARDGLEIPGYLTLPKGVEPRNLPAIVLPHGGPWGRDVWGYDAFAQFLANRGYAVLQPNFRGSTGYGAKFLDAGNDEWGTGAMQHDITDGVAWLVEQGIADRARVGIMGGSYGGYATLAGLAFTPDIYAAGVDIVGPSNIITLLESIPPYWAPLKKAFDLRVGDMRDPEDLERMKRQSPLHSATRITAPLLVIQGANDPRVKKRESDQIVVALRDLGRKVEYVVAPDEGHGFAGRVNRIAMMVAIEKFLAQHLKGRFQEDVREAIAQRLAQITVRIDTLQVQQPEQLAPARAAEFSGAAVQPGTWKYNQKLQLMGQTIDANTTVTVSASTHEGRPAWLLVETSSLPTGAASDTVLLDPATLAPLTRVVHQGPATIELRAHADSITGRIEAGAQRMPISLAKTGTVYFEGTPLNLAIATLPLAPGFAASLKTFNVMGAKTKDVRIEVTGVEQVTVPAGAGEAFRVELRPADGDGGTTLWIERSGRRLLRAETKLPAAMGGGTAVAELIR